MRVMLLQERDTDGDVPMHEESHTWAYGSGFTGMCGCQDETRSDRPIRNHKSRDCPAPRDQPCQVRAEAEQYEARFLEAGQLPQLPQFASA